MRRTWALVASGALILLGAAAAALAATPKSGNWKGTTSQTFPNTTITGSCPLHTPGPAPVCFTVSSNRSIIVDFEPAFEGSCTKSGSPPMTSPVITSDAGRNIAIKSGKFHASAAHAVIHEGSLTLATATDQVTGKFTSAKAAKGTYSVTFTFNNGSAAQQAGLAGYTCKTGTVSWTAKAG
jgi:hypothetical protein